jgi:ribonuclease HI
MPKNNFYVVWKGRTNGIFDTWDECALQVNGYPGAEYKGFSTRTEAEAALSGSLADHTAAEPPRISTELDLRRIGRPITQSYSVDAACSSNPGVLEYRCVHNQTRNEIFRQGPFELGTNNIGEFLAIVHALALFKRKGIASPIYSDSAVAIEWITCKECRTKLSQATIDARLSELIERAEKWLLDNDYQNRVLKWHTEVWGEIPADFGRKL